MRRISIIAMVWVCASVTLEAQNEIQALRYSRHNPFGTARFASQGGAIGALGGDLTAVQVNPAGLGFYRATEYSFTPSFYWVNTTSEYMGITADDSRFRFNVGSTGFVAAHNSKRKSGFVGGAFAFGYNTLVNFNNSMTIRGLNNQSSLLDDFTWHANQDPGNLSPFYEEVAINAYLLPYDSIAGEYWNDIEDGGYGQQQTRYLDQSGYIGEYSVSGAFNFSNFLYFGITSGFHSVRFYEEIYHDESDPGDILPNINNFQFREFNSTHGWGYTMRFGLIIRPIQLLRVGATFQIPTFYYLTEEKFTDAFSSFDRNSGIPDGNAFSPTGVYDYDLKAPMRINAHASVILMKMATISAAYEYIDYSAAELESYDDIFLNENENIRRDFQAVHNLRAGGELKLNIFYLRGGLQYLMSPYSDSRNNEEEWIYSGGIGVRTKVLFFDLSYSRGQRSEVYGLYESRPGISEVSINQIHTNNIMFTTGIRF